MPYIKQDRRKLFEEEIASLHKKFIDNNGSAGDLNYIITMLLKAYLDQHGQSYETYNSIIGCLESCKQEYYRKSIAGYEDLKEKMNGSV